MKNTLKKIAKEELTVTMTREELGSVFDLVNCYTLDLYKGRMATEEFRADLDGAFKKILPVLQTPTKLEEQFDAIVHVRPYGETDGSFGEPQLWSIGAFSTREEALQAIKDEDDLDGELINSYVEREVFHGGKWIDPSELPTNA